MGVDICLTIVDPTTKNISEYKSDDYESSIKNSQNYLKKVIHKDGDEVDNLEEGNENPNLNSLTETENATSPTE